MATFASGFNFTNALQSLTKDRVITDYIVDTFFDTNKGWQYLRQRGMVDDATGGLALSWPINISSSPNTTTFDGDDNLPISSMNSNINRAALDWKKYQDALVVVLTDTLYNDGSPDAVANMVEAQLDITKMSLVNKLSDDWVKNTNAINSKGLNGLAECVDDSTVITTYAGLSRTTLGAVWKAQVNYTNTNTTGSAINNLQKLFISAQVDNDTPDFFMVTRLFFGTIMQTLYTNDRYIQPDLARNTAGTNLLFMGNPMFIDSHVPTSVTSPAGGGSAGGLAYALNSNYIKLVIHPDWNFAMTEWQMAQNNLTVFTRILFAGNLVCLKPSAQAVLFTVAV